MKGVFVGIGCTDNQDLAADVLEYSIVSASKQPTEFEINKMHLMSSWEDLKQKVVFKNQRTPFSLQRFLVAKEVVERNFEYGLYIDSDMLVLNDVFNLFESMETDICTPDVDSSWNRKRQTAVLAMTNKGAHLLYDYYQSYLNDEIDYDELIYLKYINDIGDLDTSWNSLEYLDKNTSLLHFTDMDTQPWLRRGNPNAGIWNVYLFKYINSVGIDRLKREVKSRNVNPFLMDLFTFGPSFTSISNRALLLDLFFIPKHRFKRLSNLTLRTCFAPALKIAIEIQFRVKNGQVNVR
jgi:lipopolysaccharide biosynthesis glycosyltransferase